MENLTFPIEVSLDEMQFAMITKQMWDALCEGLSDFTVEVAGKLVPSDPSVWSDELREEFARAYYDIHRPRS